MSMTIGNNGGPSADMNVTPLIDVLLVLIIIFMVITPMMPTGLNALVPQEAVKTEAPPPVSTVVVQVFGAGDSSTLKINEEDVTWDNLQARLFDIFKTRNQRVIFVKGDTTLDFAQVARVIDSAHAAGIDNVGLMTKTGS